MSSPWISTITKIKDGQEVRQSVVNPIFEQLSQRDQYLYERLQETANKSNLISFDVPIHPDEAGIATGVLHTVYYNKDINGEGVKRTVVSFGLSSTQTFFSANDSSYCYGIVKSVGAAGFVDLWISGLVELSFDIDDPTSGLIDLSLGEIFDVGPYYLSRTTPGKISKNPNGIAIFVGYAISKRKFLLSPNVDEFSQLFVNYRFDLLDRPTATPVLTTGTWSIPSSNINRLGWLDVVWLQANSPSTLAAYTIPAGAKFLYNIPNSYTADNADNSGAGSLTTFEKTSGTDLKSLIPPHPANFVELFVNGVLQKFNDVNTVDGLYSITEYGIWWFSAADGLQPWASDIGGGWVPANWPSTKGSDYLRPRIFLQFGKFNPTLKDTLVSSVDSFVDGSNNSSLSIGFFDRKTKLPAKTGDLLAKFNIVNGTDVVAASAATTVSTVNYDQVAGKLILTKIPVVSTLKLDVNSKMTIVNDGNGNFTLGDTSSGSSGAVVDLEPENINLDYLGQSLHSYLKFPVPTTVTNYGVVGKIVLPSVFPITNDMYIVVHLFGFNDVSGANRNVAFDFSYNVSSCINTVAGISDLVVTNNNPSVYSLKETDSTPSTVTLVMPSDYLAKQPIVFGSSFLIPKANIGPESVVNFRIKRKVPGSNVYGSPIGALAFYWRI